jgi:hypothetical protein
MWRGIRKQQRVGQALKPEFLGVLGLKKFEHSKQQEADRFSREEINMGDNFQEANQQNSTTRFLGAGIVKVQPFDFLQRFFFPLLPV